MSSPDRGLRPLAVAGLLVAGLALSGCTTTGIRPLYGSSGSGTVVALKDVDVTTSGRIGQQIRNDVVFGFSGGAGEPVKPRWRLEIATTDVDTAVGIDRYANLATGRLDQISANWVLTEVGTNRTLVTGTSFANAAYDYSQQRFADVRAKRDAENRAAQAIALDIRTKIAVWFSEHPAP
jgi:LPS-assembly lipoprotein